MGKIATDICFFVIVKWRLMLMGLVLFVAVAADGRTVAKQDESGGTYDAEAVVGADGAVRVRAKADVASFARVAYDFPVRADWKVRTRRGSGLTVENGWLAVGDGPSVVPWYALLTDGRKTYGFGVKTGPKAMCSWRIRPGGVELLLDVRAGSRPLAIGGREIEVCTVVRMESAEGESAFAFGRRFCAALCPSPRLPKEPLYGFNDWYAAYGKNTATNFLEDAAFVVSLARGLKIRPYVVMDDGWQRYSPPEVEKLTGKFDSGYGPWEESSPQFGMDMKTFCRKIAELDARPGLWYRPLCMQGRRCDPSDPEVVARIRADVRRFRDWGFRFIKIDYLTFDVCGHFKGFDGDGRLIRNARPWKRNDRTTAEVISGLYRAIREEAGDDIVLLGCNALNHLCAGIFDTTRVGSDTSGKDWRQTRRNGVGAVAFKGIENGVFYAADPDCAGLAGPGLIPWEKNRQWIDLLSRSGMPFFISWRRDLADADVRKTLSEGFRRSVEVRQTAEPLTWMEESAPRRWRTATGEVEYDW